MAFKEYLLEEVTEAIFSGGTPSTKNELYWNGKFNWLSSGESRNRIIKETEKKITLEGINNSSTRLAQRHDIIMASAGQGITRGQTSFLNIDTYINQSIVALRADDKKLDARYLFYNLNSRYSELRAISDSASTRGSITTAMLKRFPIKLPSKDIQEKIAEILWSFDNKIELNNQMIDTLEEMASALFKRWFVDFEFPDVNGNPYKSSGGKMIDSELGEIPEGWEIGKLSDYGDVVGGGTPSKKKQEYYDNGTVSWITPKDLSELKVTFIEKGKLSITDEALKKSSAKLVPKGTVLFSSRAPIGYMAIAKNSLTTNQGFKSIVPNDSMSSFFIYLWLKRNLEMIKSLGTGSTFKEVSGGTMKNIDTIIPKSKIVSQFDEIIVPIFKLIEKCESENSSLIDTRDTLLPKLLSGEIEF
ncbi:MAG: restriction endonuclease subunit S [Vagococcus sp.]|uniref:restriction endonuclease subunit S n=1 Tax=Vagococcus sp. TaxID=1933889 RepID=UPI002FC9BE12